MKTAAHTVNRVPTGARVRVKRRPIFLGCILALGLLLVCVSGCAQAEGDNARRSSEIDVKSEHPATPSSTAPPPESRPDAASLPSGVDTGPSSAECDELMQHFFEAWGKVGDCEEDSECTQPLEVDPSFAGCQGYLATGRDDLQVVGDAYADWYYSKCSNWRWVCLGAVPTIAACRDGKCKYVFF
jgi:hypothetical protein